MRHKVEPQMILPCHDIDGRAMGSLLRTVSQFPSSDDVKDEGKEELQFLEAESGIYRIGLYLALASANCNLILIDADTDFATYKEHHSIMEMAESLGHQVNAFEWKVNHFD
jgi:hypothetical protein